MAYINITGDSDGDLHTAAMHNSKFGAIASVLNGNVDHDNLTYPRSLLTWNITTNKGYMLDDNDPDIGTTWSDVALLSATDKTIGTLSATANGPILTTGYYIAVLSSYMKAPVGLEHVATSVICIDDPAFTNSAGMELIFQTSSALAGGSGTYSDIATATFDPDAGGVALTPTEIAMSYSSNTIAANSFFRVIYRNPTSGSLAGDLMPNLKIAITWKAYTVS